MYIPAAFAEDRAPVLHALMAQHPLATLVATAPSGIVAHHLPLRFEPGAGVLVGHIARANPLWKEIADGAEVLAIFQGASRYISPSWYPSKRRDGKVVPTWNYAVVQARGAIAWTQDVARLRAIVESLTDEQERGSAHPWRVDDAPAEYIERMLGAIVGFNIRVAQLTGKWKVSQNRSAEDRAGVVAALSAFEDDGSRAMAGLVARVADPDSR